MSDASDIPHAPQTAQATDWDYSRNLADLDALLLGLINPPSREQFDYTDMDARLRAPVPDTDSDRTERNTQLLTEPALLHGYSEWNQMPPQSIPLRHILQTIELPLQNAPSPGRDLEEGVPTPVEIETLGQKGSVDRRCHICHNECYISESTLETGHPPARLPCEHVFGKQCVEEWIRSHNSCPLCRAPVSSHSLPRRPTISEASEILRALNASMRSYLWRNPADTTYAGFWTWINEQSLDEDGIEIDAGVRFAARRANARFTTLLALDSLRH